MHPSATWVARPGQARQLWCCSAPLWSLNPTGYMQNAFWASLWPPCWPLSHSSVLWSQLKCNTNTSDHFQQNLPQLWVYAFLQTLSPLGLSPPILMGGEGGCQAACWSPFFPRRSALCSMQGQTALLSSSAWLMCPGCCPFQSGDSKHRGFPFGLMVILPLPAVALPSCL